MHTTKILRSISSCSPVLKLQSRSESSTRHNPKQDDKINQEVRNDLPEDLFAYTCDLLAEIRAQVGQEMGYNPLCNIHEHRFNTSLGTCKQKTNSEKTMLQHG